MFHFGLPSEPLDHSIPPSKQISRYKKLMYIGPFNDPLPLPLAKKLIYVDIQPGFWLNHSCGCNKYGKYNCFMPKCLIDGLITQAKDYFKIKDPVVVEWSTLQYRPIAKVTFKWKDMHNLTKDGDVSELTYIFETRDFEMGTNEKLKTYSDDVDIIWICGFEPSAISFKHIDLSMVTMAIGYWDIPLEYQNCAGFFYLGPIVSSKRAIDSFYNGNGYYGSILPYHPNMPLKIDDIPFLLGCIFSKNSLNFEDFSKQAKLFDMNNPPKYNLVKYCKTYKTYKTESFPIFEKSKEKPDYSDIYSSHFVDIFMNCDGSTLIHEYAKEGNFDALRILLKKTDIPNIEDNLGNSALDLARRSSHNNLDVIKILEQYCDKKWVPLFEAAFKGDIEKIKQMIEIDGIDVNIRSVTTGSTALTIAVQNGKSLAVKYLLLNGANANIRRNDGKSSLHLAAEGGYFMICKYLIENSAEIDCEWVDEARKIGDPVYTPLKQAVRKGHFDIIKLLASNGANVKRIHGLENIIKFL